MTRSNTITFQYGPLKVQNSHKVNQVPSPNTDADGNKNHGKPAVKITFEE